MKIFLLKNTGINQERTILKLNDSNFDDYLKFKNPLYSQNTKDENWKKINGTKINKLEFSEVLEIKNPSNYDYCAVFNFPFAKNKITYFFIDEINFISKNQYKFNFKIDLISSFQPKEIFNAKNKIMLEQGHLRQNTNFNFIDGKTQIKENAFFRKEQLINQNLEKEIYYKQNKIKNAVEEEIANIYNFKKWIIIYAKKEAITNSSLFGDNITISPKETNKDESINESVPFEYVVLCVPYSQKNVKFYGIWDDFEENLEFKKEEVGVSGYEIYLWLQKNDLFIYAHIIDHLPLSNVFLDDEKRINGFNFKSVLANEGKLKFAIPSIEFISQKRILIPYKIENNLWKWEKINDKWDENNNEWSVNQEAIINFSPFKNFEIGLFSETTNSGFKWNFNKIINTNTSEENFLKLGSTYEVFLQNQIYTLNDFLEDQDKNESLLFGEQNFFKLKRSVEMPFNNDLWISYVNKKALGGAQDFLIPALALGGAVLTGGVLSAGLAVSSTLGATGTILNRKNKKKQADPLSGTATDINGELIISYNTKTLKIERLINEDINKIAFNFHKFGYFLFDLTFNIFEILTSRARFNYLKISSRENTNIFNQNLDIWYKNEYLKVLKNGITFWIFTEKIDNIRKQNIFKY